VASSRSTAGNRLGLDDWIQAGFALLAEEGIKALKIDRLCDRLGVTKGSFYWHFDGMPSYRATLIQSWGELRDEDRRAFDDMDGLAPRERLTQMMTSLVSPRHWTLERAMRVPMKPLPGACAPRTASCCARFARPSWTTASTSTRRR
jgi:AcrR family transcriptional regulator